MKRTSTATRRQESAIRGFGEEVEGVVQGHRDGHGFVVSDSGGPDVYLSPMEMRAVLHKDLVRVRVLRHDRRGRAEGKVLDILSRSTDPIIGRLLQEAGAWIVAPEDKRYGQDVLIPRGGTAKAKEGQVVVVELTETPSLHAQPMGRVVEVLGDIDDPGMEIEIAVRKYRVPHVFSKAALARAKELPEKVRPTDCKGRVDLRDVPLITIDGEDARDFDDAVYAHKLELEGTEGFRLVVAIADVSHYVASGDAIDVDAFERATSVYFPRRVIPMLPEKLSNGLCSLNPGVDRLCLVADMVIEHDGEVGAYQFYPAVMHSHARFTYTEVASVLVNTRGTQAAKHADRLPGLIDLHDCYRALLRARSRRGAVDFETTETQIVCDESGRIERIEPRHRNEAHRMIEEAMLAANTCAADFILNAQHPSLFRVHEGPTPEKRTALANYLKAVGVTAQLPDAPRPGDLQAVALQVRDRPDSQQIHAMLLRSMQQAVYSPHNGGHFGLAYSAYTHFTSPIRRYPDLLVHRVIKAILRQARYDLDLDIEGLESTAESRSMDEVLRWEAAGAHCSANERRADEASRDVEAWLKCRYMRDKLGEEFAGTVTSVTSFGLFVVLDALYVDGLVHITELGGEYYRFDEARQELRGERTGMRYTIGARVRVQVIRVDLDGRRIDFRLVEESMSLTDESPAAKRRLPKPDAEVTSDLSESLASNGHRRPDNRVSARRASSKTSGSATKRSSNPKEAARSVSRKSRGPASTTQERRARQPVDRSRRG
jgi:ribonuclease R